MTPRTRHYLIAGALGLVTIGLIVKLQKQSKNDSAHATTAKPVSITESQQRDIRRLFTIHSTLYPWKEAAIRPPAQTTIREVVVKVGDSVEKDQVLLRADSEIQKIKRELEKIDYELKNLDFNVTLALARKNFLSHKEVSQRKLEHRASELRAKLSQIENTGEIKSPIKGMVSEVGFKVGDFFDGQGQSVVKVVDTTKLRVPVYLPQEIAAQLRSGSKAVVRTNGGNLAEAILNSISPSVDPKTGSVFAEYEVSIVPEGVLSGMYAFLEVELEAATDAITIPKSALIHSEGKTFVYRYVAHEDRAPSESNEANGSRDDSELGQVQKIEIQTGISEADSIQVLKGLEDLDQIVIRGQGDLSDGTQVEVIR